MTALSRFLQRFWPSERCLGVALVGVGLWALAWGASLAAETAPGPQLGVPAVVARAEQPAQPSGPSGPSGETYRTDSPPPPDLPAADVAQIVPIEGELMTIDLQTAWRLAGVQNPTINIARNAILQADVAHRQAVLAWLPNLNAGSMLHQHSGVLIASGGQIRRLTETSFYIGGGARTVAAESNSIPMIQFFVPFADGLFNPLATRQETAIMQYEASATNNNIMLDVTTAYLDLLEAETQVEALKLSGHNMQQVVNTTRAYAQTGQGRAGDANRAAAEGYLLLTDIQTAAETLAVNSAALARLLHLDPNTRLKTPGGPLRTFNLVDVDRPLNDLIEVAVRYRPEMSARTMAIAESQTRLRQEQKRPLLPLVTSGYSVGGFGGTGSYTAVNPPNVPASPFTSLAPRTDFDVMAVWTLQNMGAGNIARANQRRAQLDQSVYDRVRIVNQIRNEVTEAYGFCLGERNSVRIALRRLVEAENGFREDYQRFLGFEALPIEVLNSARLLVGARTTLVQAFIGDNEAQFRLFVAMGSPPYGAADALREQLPQTNQPLLPENQPPAVQPAPPQSEVPKS